MTMLPNVSYIGLGPGSGNVYIRGISSGGESSLGANPSVAVYLDDQPVTATGAYLNPHIYDVSRIEVLAGPREHYLVLMRSPVLCELLLISPTRGNFQQGLIWISTLRKAAILVTPLKAL